MPKVKRRKNKLLLLALSIHQGKGAVLHTSTGNTVKSQDQYNHQGTTYNNYQDFYNQNIQNNNRRNFYATLQNQPNRPNQYRSFNPALTYNPYQNRYYNTNDFGNNAAGGNQNNSGQLTYPNYQPNRPEDPIRPTYEDNFAGAEFTLTEDGIEDNEGSGYGTDLNSDYIIDDNSSTNPLAPEQSNEAENAAETAAATAAATDFNASAAENTNIAENQNNQNQDNNNSDQSDNGSLGEDPFQSFDGRRADMGNINDDFGGLKIHQQMNLKPAPVNLKFNKGGNNVDSSDSAGLDSSVTVSKSAIEKSNELLPETEQITIKNNGQNNKNSNINEINIETTNNHQNQDQNNQKQHKNTKNNNNKQTDTNTQTEAHHGISMDRWNEEDCYINGFPRCLNGGICSASMKKCFCATGFTGDRCQFANCDSSRTLVNGTCNTYDLLMVKVEAPGISRMVQDLGIPIRELSSKSSTSLGARDILREHIYMKLSNDGPKLTMMRGASIGSLAVAKPNAQAQTASREDIPINNGKIDTKLDLDVETIGVSVEWFDISDTVDAKMKLSLPLGSGHDIKKWERILKQALSKSILLDVNTLEVSDFDECNSEFNRCSSKHSTICENLPGNYQCRCIGNEEMELSDKSKSQSQDKSTTFTKTNTNTESTCQDPCIRSDGLPFCANNGRCIPVLATQKAVKYKNSYNMAGNSHKYAYLEERLEDVYDTTKDPTCYCTEKFYGSFCQFQEKEDTSVLISVWIISGILFLIVVTFLSRKIYKLVSNPATNGDTLTRGSSMLSNSMIGSRISPPHSFNYNTQLPQYNDRINAIRTDLMNIQRNCRNSTANNQQNIPHDNIVIGHQASTNYGCPDPTDRNLNQISNYSNQVSVGNTGPVQLPLPASIRNNMNNASNNNYNNTNNNNNNLLIEGLNPISNAGQTLQNKSSSNGFVLHANYDDNTRMMNSQKKAEVPRHIYAYY